MLDHLDGISYRKLIKRYQIDKDKLCKIVNSQMARFKNNFEITKQFLNQLNYSGNHIVDGKYVPVKEDVGLDKIISGKIPRSKKRRKVKKGRVLIWGADYDSHDLPHHEFGESESDFTFDKYFRQLKSIDYPLKSLTADDQQEIIKAVKRYYPDCVIQLCVKHYLTKVSQELAVGCIKIKIKAREKQINNLFINDERDYIPPSRFCSIKRAVRLSNEIAGLEFKYELLLDFQKIIQSILNVDDYEIALRRIKSLQEYFWPTRLKTKGYFPKKHVSKITKLILDFEEHQEYLLNYLKYPHLNIPRTTNLIEGYNSQLELRLASIRGFETFETAKNYINAWIIKRRFSKFTDCKDPFKNLNGKVPLECAGVDISSIKDWIRWCQKLDNKN